MSAPSPCSVPEWLRAIIPLESERAQAACTRHDSRYERGGDRHMRLVTDLVFCLDLLGVPPDVLEMLVAHATFPEEGAMDGDMAEKYLWACRMYAFGPAHWAGGDGPGALPPAPPEVSQAP